MTDCPIPEEFVDPEDDAELQYPGLPIYETADSTLRQLWDPWRGVDNGGSFVPGTLFGRPIGAIPEPAVPAYRALECALRSAGYVARSGWSFNDRTIAGSATPSLHAYGIAVDLDPDLNPYGVGDPYSGAIKRAHVEAVLSIRNRDGAAIWSWGGNWRKPDRMHFQLDQGPDRVEVDWSTVPGWRPTDDRSEQVLGLGSRGEAVAVFQRSLRRWNAEALVRTGADGTFGPEMECWVRRFQQANGLASTGVVDGLTAALLVMQEVGAGPGRRSGRSATDRLGWSTGPAHRPRLSAGG